MPDIEEMPKAYRHCVNVYERMVAESGDFIPFEGGKPMTRYVGFTSHIFRELGLAMPMYTQVLRTLTAMGCIEQLRRGGGQSPSEWALLKPPSPEAYSLLNDRGMLPQHARNTSKEAMQDQRIVDHTQQLNEIIRTVEALKDITLALVTRLERLEQRVNEMESSKGLDLLEGAQ